MDFLNEATELLKRAEKSKRYTIEYYGENEIMKKVENLTAKISRNLREYFQKINKIS
jgi:hypothetical protein